MMKVFAIAAALAALFTAAPVGAALVSVNFAGTQTRGTPLNAQITGTFVYDDAAPDTNPLATRYDANSIGSWSFSVTGPSGTICSNSSTGGAIVVTDNAIAIRDAIGATMPTGCTAAGSVQTLVLTLRGGATDLWSDALPTYDKWTKSGFFLAEIRLLPLLIPIGASPVTFSVDSISASILPPVPAPGAAALFLSALALSMLRRRGFFRRAKAPQGVNRIALTGRCSY